MDDVTELSDEIDRTIAEAFDVDMSPDFVARVRQRLATEPNRPPFRHGWRIAVPLAVAGAAIVVVGVAMPATRGPTAPPLLAARTVAVGQLRPADVRPAPARQEPEVLVPPEETAMYRRLIADAQRVPPAVAVETTPAIVAAWQTSDITIDPIRIDRIAPPDGAEGDRQ